jgi:hypothetical protein
MAGIMLSRPPDRACVVHAEHGCPMLRQEGGVARVVTASARLTRRWWDHDVMLDEHRRNMMFVSES